MSGLRGLAGRLMPTSLGGRLLAGSALFTLIALLFTLGLMWQVLSRFVTGQIDQRLDNKIVALSSQLRVAPDRRITLEGDADGPPFDKRHHHAFWFIRGPANDLHSRWLQPSDFVPPADAEIATLPTPPPPIGADDELSALERDGRPQTLVTSGPGGLAMHMRVARRSIGGVPVTIFVAAPVESITHPMREALTTISIAVAGLGLALIAAALVQVRLGLRPLGRLRREVAAVRDGRAALLPVAQPAEIEPLVTELNALLAQNAANLERARRHVANLAHGLKTPLATLALSLERMPGDDGAAARKLATLVERRIRHHLARARAAALEGPARSRTPLAVRLGDLGDALARIHAGRQVVFALECPPEAAIACEPQDVDEIFGNLLDNAFKYTRERVACEVREVGRQTIVEIADDGPGLSAQEIARVLRPGQRLDEDIPGYGFGLPIARELVELYGGTLALAGRERGLVVTVRLPAAR
ncbi:Signal transduction histidine kinase [Beijerinckiaceae bacterium RH AL1]|nr:Signal transduction histidine kinase [Beijerinckiaceae bacterium RH CH11]VVB46913.1 Signal transduction histidine kinase [Beijerinckiaceae bacterium RH AL8]VVC55580.1 Signal transduction histidine kinase [Beijerinckiaceae bacterium RH AL1]